MELMSLNSFISYIFTMIFISLSYLVGLRILSKYRETKTRIYIPIGIAWILLASFWISEIYNFIPLYVMKEAFMFEGNFKQLFDVLFISLALIVWIHAFLLLISLASPWIKKIILLSYIVIESVIISFYFYFFYSNIIINDTIIYYLSAIFSIISFLVTGLIFVKKTLNYKERKWNGRFLFIAFLTFTIGILLELIGTLIESEENYFYLIGSFILIFSSIFYYWGFFLPEWIKTRLGV